MIGYVMIVFNDGGFLTSRGHVRRGNMAMMKMGVPLRCRCCDWSG